MTPKCRGLTKDGKWVKGYYCEVGGKHYIIPDDAEYGQGIALGDIIGSIEVLPETVGMFTGLLDKNEREIYGQDYVMSPNGAIGLIEYQTDALNSGFVIKLIKGKDFRFDDYMGRKVGFNELEVRGIPQKERRNITVICEDCHTQYVTSEESIEKGANCCPLCVRERFK